MSKPDSNPYGAMNSISDSKPEEIKKPSNSGFDGGLGGLGGLTEIPSLDFEVGGSGAKAAGDGDSGGYQPSFLSNVPSRRPRRTLQR
jgi:hypothetical protein